MTAPAIMRECRRCSAPFRISPSHAARPNAGKFCSIDCANKSRRSQVERACQQCGKAFMVKPSTVANGHGKFCSFDCANAAKSGVPTATSKANTQRKAATPTPVVRSKSVPNIPHQREWDLNGGSMVWCAGPVQPRHQRERGTFCPSCEWRAFQEVAS